MLLTIMGALTGAYAAFLVVFGVVVTVRNKRRSRRLRARVNAYGYKADRS